MTPLMHFRSFTWITKLMFTLFKLLHTFCISSAEAPSMEKVSRRICSNIPINVLQLHIYVIIHAFSGIHTNASSVMAMSESYKHYDFVCWYSILQ